MSFLRTFLALGLCIFSGCSRAQKEASPAQAKPAGASNPTTPQNTLASNPSALDQLSLLDWGTKFNFAPLSEKGSSAEKNAGKALLRIETVEGGLGSGFFISPDGILLTNHHVIENGRCTRERCRGIRAIRELSSGGALEVFQQFRLLASNQELDFSVLQVLDTSGATPHLNFHSLDDAKISTAVLALGHPHGSSLMISRGVPRSVSDETLNLYLPVAPGMSGGPALDAESLGVVGLISSHIYELKDASSGNVLHTTRAIRPSHIKAALERSFEFSLPTNAGQFQRIKPAANSRTLPMSRQEALAKFNRLQEPNLISEMMPIFFGQLAFTQEGSRAMRMVANQLAKRETKAQELQFFSGTLMDTELRAVDRSTGAYHLLMDQAEASALLKEADPQALTDSNLNHPIQLALRLRAGTIQKQECISFILNKSRLVNEVHRAFRILGCYDFGLDGLGELSANIRANNSDRYIRFLNSRAAEKLISNIRLAAASDIEIAHQILALLADPAMPASISLQANGLLRIFEKSPALLNLKYEMSN